MGNKSDRHTPLSNSSYYIKKLLETTLLNKFYNFKAIKPININKFLDIIVIVLGIIMLAVAILAAITD